MNLFQRMMARRPKDFPLKDELLGELDVKTDTIDRLKDTIKILEGKNRDLIRQKDVLQDKVDLLEFKLESIHNIVKGETVTPWVIPTTNGG